LDGEAVMDAGAMNTTLEAGKLHNVPMGIAAATPDAIQKRMTEG